MLSPEVSSYEMPGTEIEYGGIPYTTTGTDIAYGGICLPACYAMCGTDFAYQLLRDEQYSPPTYQTTRLLRHVRY
eukprot:3395326-Rhodomonas_salina.1